MDSVRSASEVIVSVRVVASPGRDLLFLRFLTTPIPCSHRSSTSHCFYITAAVSLIFSLQNLNQNALWSYDFLFMLSIHFSPLIPPTVCIQNLILSTNIFSLPLFPLQIQWGMVSFISCPELIAVLLLVVKSLSAFTSEEATFLRWAKLFMMIYSVYII